MTLKASPEFIDRAFRRDEHHLKTEHPTIEVRFMGRDEKGNRYAVFVNGRERQPWTGKREAEREAKALREMCAAPSTAVRRSSGGSSGALEWTGDADERVVPLKA